MKYNESYLHFVPSHELYLLQHDLLRNNLITRYQQITFYLVYQCGHGCSTVEARTLPCVNIILDTNKLRTLLSLGR